MTSFILRLFQTPSSFRADPWGYLRNQVAHGYLIGGAGTLILTAQGWSPDLALAVVLALYGLWELAQWRLARAEGWDCLEDVAFVAVVAISVARGVPEGLVVHALFLAAGFRRRRADQGRMVH
jgi:hypothetical protein